MGISEPFIRRPVATSLLSVAVLLAGLLAYRMLPVAPLPQVEFPVIQVQAFLPGASPETMAASVATPLERQFSRIAGVTEMTSTSLLGATTIVLQFDLDRSIDAAARDVQAAINAARSDLPPNLPNNPNYRKINPADAPVMILSLTSETLPVGRVFDAADSVLAQKLSQVEGVGQFVVGGGARPAVRVRVDPGLLAQLGISVGQVRAALAAVNANSPKGELAGAHEALAISANDQLFEAEQYRPVIVAYRNGAPVRLDDVAEVESSVEDVRTAGLANGKRAVLMIVYRQPGANMIATADRVRALMPELQASIPAAVELAVVLDRTTTIRASFRDIQITLLISIVLVVLVVFVFLQTASATLIPSVAVPLSLLGTVAAMYFLGYSLDNLSLMALTVSTGFVVDDAIVVLENITRYLERGDSPLQAALKGSREIGFTVLSMSTSLVAVFIPILLMGGLVGRLFREFAVTLTLAIAVSLLVSLSTTPMMCARFLRPSHERRRGRVARFGEGAVDGLRRLYARTLTWVLRHQRLTLLATVATVCVNLYLFTVVPKGFFPQQDTGRIIGSIQAQQDVSFPSMRTKMVELANTVLKDPAVEYVVGFTGGGGNTTNAGRVFISLKPLHERKASADQIIDRLRGALAHVPGATLFLQPVQDVRIGGRQSNAQYQYTIQSQDLEELNAFAPRMLAKLRELPQLRDVATDQQNRGLQARLVIDRDTASRLGIQARVIDDALYDRFGQRQVSTIFTERNQYRVVLEVAPDFQKSPDALSGVYVRSAAGAQVPLSTFARFAPSTTPLAVSHQGQFPAVTLSFNLALGASLGDAVTAIQKAEREVGFPATIRASFQGTAQAFQASLANQPILILAALVAVYIVLGVLYESFIHPITILSTLPSAGVGALLALLLCRMDLDIIGLIGLILLIGIVKKNAIMMIDFAVDTSRRGSVDPATAIYEACLLRFRPIMMTTMAALLGALPLAVGTGVGAELRRPLGITIVGGLLVSQLLTLYTTPVVYLYLERLRLALGRARRSALTRPSFQPHVLLLLLAAATCAACGDSKAESKAPPRRPVVPVAVAAVEQKTMPLQIQAIGTVEPFAVVAIRAQVGGELLAVHVKEGQDVRKGDLLFTIDPRVFESVLAQAQANLAKDQGQIQQARAVLERDQARVAQAQAALARDQAQAKNADAQAERYADLFKRELIAREQYDQFRTNADALAATVRADEADVRGAQETVRADQAAVRAAEQNARADEAAVESARLQLGYTTIRSPIDGRTGSLQLNQGNIVRATGTNDSTLLTINQVRPIYVSFTVPQQELPAVKRYMASGRLNVNAVPAGDPRPVAGVVTFIDNTVEATTGTIRLKATFGNDENRLWPGQFANVTLTLASEPNTLVIPSPAVQTGQRGTYVFVVKSDATVELRPVVVARTQGGASVIAKGLQAGEKVVTDGQPRLAPGTKVEVRSGGGS
jgi:multidrug efflux pump